MAQQDPAARFARPRTMHRFTARRITVTRVTEIEHFTRVTFSSPELADWRSTGPEDHAKIFFPDPHTGELRAPTPVGPDADGIVRPEGEMFGRDFTPLNVRVDAGSGHTVFDLDVLRHEDPGPAARWAVQAELGDELVMVGPRGSIAAAAEAPRVVCFADETALPAVARWIESMPRNARIEVVADIPEPLDWVRLYLAAQGGRDVPVTAAPGSLDEAAQQLDVDAETYVFAGGEAGRLVPLRRYLRRELGFAKEQYSISGYWKRAESGFDHHAPIDPEDPED